MSKKGVLKKVILICNQSKKYYIKNWNKKKIATLKIYYLFDFLVILKINRQIF